MTSTKSTKTFSIGEGRPPEHPHHWSYPKGPDLWVPSVPFNRCQILATLAMEGGQIESLEGKAGLVLYEKIPFQDTLTYGALSSLLKEMEDAGLIKREMLNVRRTKVIRLVQWPPEWQEYLERFEDYVRASRQEPQGVEMPEMPAASIPPEDTSEILGTGGTDGGNSLADILRAIAHVLDQPLAPPPDEGHVETQDIEQVSYLERRLHDQTEAYNAERRKRKELEEQLRSLREQYSKVTEENRTLIQTNEQLVRNIRQGVTFKKSHGGTKIMDLVDNKTRIELERLMKAVPHIGNGDRR